MTYIKLPYFAIPWRAFPVFIFLAINVLLKTRLNKSYTAVTFLFNAGISALLVMMYAMCIIVEIYRPVYLPAFISGTVLLIAVAFAVIRGGYRVLLPTLLLKFIPFLIVFLYYWKDGEHFRGFMKFVNTIAAIAGFSILSEWIERLRIKEYQVQSLLIFKNNVIEEKALIMDN